MFKKVVSLFMTLLLTALLVFPLFAESVPFTINVSDCTVEVKQGSAILFSGSSSGTFNANSEGEPVTVTITTAVPAEGFYPEISGEVKTTKTFDPTISGQTISAALKPLSAPTVALSPNTANGGLSYTITNTSGVQASRLELQIYEGGNAVELISPADSSGSIPISSKIVAGKSYTARARQSSFNNTYFTALGAQSNSATAVAVYTLSAKASAAEGGTLGNFAGNYVEGRQISISASALAGYKFAGWESSDGGSFEDSKAASTTFTMPAKNTTVTALFKKAFKFVIMSSTGGKVWDVDGEYFEGEEVRVSAIPGDGYVFDSWVSSDGGKFADSKAVATTFFMPANATTVTATFKEDSNTTTNPDPDNNGENTDNPGAIEGMFEIKTRTSEGGNIVINQNRAQEGQKITVRATAKAGFVFDGWSSEGGGSFADDKAASTTFTMPAGDVTIIADFVPGDGTAAPDTGEDSSADKEKGTKSGTIWLILAGVGALVAAGAGALFIINERKKRSYRNFNDGFAGGDTAESDPDYSYSDAETREIDPPDRNASPDGSLHEKFKWRNTRRPKNRSRDDNKFRAEDWDD